MDASENGDQTPASSRASSPGRYRSKPRYDSENDNTTVADTSIVDTMARPAKTARSRKSQSNAAGAARDAGLQTIGKIRHLKKEDGEPLWRKDIQYDFLRAVFDNERKVFTNSYDHTQTEKQTFADLYIDTMARSSKTSKVLRDKLLSDREAAKSMAMVCLLVNVGRMNTTLNFFPEMRAQLRTYHAIPSLQAYQDATAYKQLQDAPRLKSILKGAAEDRPEPHNLNEFKDLDVPRTNPVNLIFLICQQATHIADLHFPSDGEFHDLIMKTNFTSYSRANAFLWLMWFYLESDFTEEGCDENPFGAGVVYDSDLSNQGVPKLAPMTPEEEDQENIDPQTEIDFGREKQAHRAKIIAADAQYAQDHQPSKRSVARGKLLGDDGTSAAILPRIRPSKHESDLDSTRSTPPPRALARHLAGAGASRRGTGSLKYQIYEASSPAAPGSGALDGVVPRKPRPPTAHQLAVEHNRNQRVEYILDRGLRRAHHKARKVRKQEGGIIRAINRIEAMPDQFVDSDEEEFRYAMDKSVPFRGRGFGGLIQLTSEPDDFGEEFVSHVSAFRRAGRRLSRWEAPEYSNRGAVRPLRMHRAAIGNTPDMNGEYAEGSERAEFGEKGKSRTNGTANGDVTMEDADDLDDMDKELLGLASGAEEGDGGKDDDDDEELDDVDKTLLGLADDDTDSEG
ncbi:INO80 chromatin remodeling complex Ies1-like protein [Apiospora rasikravindrae]|uniref:INO80 chromatin remodeling complex Ies1-like protein n=1 Tax=Apiospora rasikravindrae TaxID=990691 RepID=A0ABR1RRS8_9PEZI